VGLCDNSQRRFSTHISCDYILSYTHNGEVTQYTERKKKKKECVCVLSYLPDDRLKQAQLA